MSCLSHEKRHDGCDVSLHVLLEEKHPHGRCEDVSLLSISDTCFCFVVVLGTDCLLTLQL